ncbi:alpha-amylase family protein [Pedococcus sp. 5OH_020]|uniref:alpha-amylase family protein n=1 Tax=Pedococcus sp. 5OH_020 TaxID=2989814 RepID=UPI0022E9DD82|nr:alpha-amylase family protein [Pedococcus sp. 5OH_020]
MRVTDTSDLWWKTAVIYCVDVETFYDSDGDGVGDLRGLADRIDYLAELGVTCLWLMPFYPTPSRDDGYDVVDFYGVDRRLGDHGQLVEVIRTAKDRGLRVIADLVINHTSDQHPWFKAARRSTTNDHRDFYVWRSDPPPDTSGQVVFPDKEDSIWAKDDRTGEWYLHHFYSYQPDLNTAHREVRDELARVMGFWTQLGLDGFRVDAVPFFVDDVESKGGSADHPEVPADPHQHLRDLRAFLNRRKGDAILLGEVNIPPEDQRKYFGGDEGNELHMMFDFLAMQTFYLSMAREDVSPLVRALRSRPRIHPLCQWATFVRNHDELTLDKLSQEERQEVFDAFGPEPEMQIYGRGLKRRLPPMLGGDPRRVRMAYSLLFSLPGTPTIFYGEEIGMGEDLEAEGRMAVRTPMQWTDGLNGGFSTARPGRLVSRPTPGGYGPQHVNAAQQRRDPDSLWTFMHALIRAYRQCPELGWGEMELLEQPYRQVLAHVSRWDDAAVLTVHNLGAEPVSVDLVLPDADVRLVDLLADGQEQTDEGGRVSLALQGYGYRWLRVHPRGSARLP